MSRYFANPYVNEESKPEDEAFDFPAALESVKKQLKGVVEKIVTNVPPEYATLDGGLYVGSVGIAYAFLYLSQRVPTLSTGHGFLNLAHQYLRESLNFVARKGHKSDSAFLLGNKETTHFLILFWVIIWRIKVNSVLLFFFRM